MGQQVLKLLWAKHCTTYFGHAKEAKNLIMCVVWMKLELTIQATLTCQQAPGVSEAYPNFYVDAVN